MWQTAVPTVAPLAGARIEIYRKSKSVDVQDTVAPLAGARIEIPNHGLYEKNFFVAPLAGARIEIS